MGTFNVLRLVAAEMVDLEPIGEDGERGVIINTSSGSVSKALGITNRYD